MKKFSNYKLIFAAALMVTFASCSEDDDATLNTRSVKPLVSVDQSSFSLTEGESFTVTLSVDKPLNTGLDFKLELVDGNGSFRDYEVENANESIADDGAGKIGHIINIPAYATTYSFTVTPIIDLDVEGTEVFTFALTSAVNGRGLVAEGSETITATVADYTSNDVGVSLTWDGNAPDWFGTIVEGTYASTGANGNIQQTPFTAYDFDIYIIEPNTGEDVTGFAGATGDSPEMVVIDATLPDGEYLLIADLYSAGPVPNNPFTLDLQMKVSKFGNWSTTIDIPGYTDTHPVSAPDGLGAGMTVVATLVKTGTTYVLKDADDVVLAQGRNANLLKSLKTKKVRK